MTFMYRFTAWFLIISYLNHNCHQILEPLALRFSHALTRCSIDEN